MRRLPALLLMTFISSGCLEHKERIRIHSDGAISVQVSAKGDIRDLAQGYPIPLEGPWTPTSEDSIRWIEHFGPSTGSLDVQDAVQGRPAWTSPKGAPAREAKLEVEGRFATVDEWPKSFTDKSEPYATAYSSRDAKLEFVQRGNRRVCLFERTYRRPERLVGRMWENLDDELPEAISSKFDDRKELTPAEWSLLTRVLRSSTETSAGIFVREALSSLYTEGNASMSPLVSLQVVESAKRTTGLLVTLERLREIRDILAPLDGSDREGVEDPLALLMSECRDSMRSTLVAELSRAGLESPIQNAILERLEWLFTAADHGEDLDDESFHVEVQMPGTIVSGNFDHADLDTATWKFEAKSMNGRDVLLRVVSVIE